MAWWFKASIGILRHPKVVRLRRRLGDNTGDAAWLHLLAVNAEDDCDGMLHASHIDPVGISHSINVTEQRAREVLEAMVSVGLIEMDAETGGAEITGYDDDWRPRPMTSTERSQALRRRRRRR